MEGPNLRDNPLTFPRSRAPFDLKLFSSPSAEYRGCPLWSWNSKLRSDQLGRQVKHFAEMGMGGFHMHSRVGLDTEYLGEEFMSEVRKCVEAAEQNGLLACLYDEDRWPSGSAGGKVVAGRPECKLQHLLLTPWPYGSKTGPKPPPSASGRGVRSEEGFLLARYQVDLDDSGKLTTRSRRLTPDEPADEQTWYAYIEPNPPSEWFNSETYVDTLSEPAIAKFIEITHEVYHRNLGPKFGSVVPSIFTDEPQFCHKTKLASAWQKTDIFMPWSLDLVQTFERQYGYDISRRLLEIVWDSDGGLASQARYHFHDHVCERFVTAFMDQLSNWCRSHDILLTGHMMKEPFLWSQTGAVGEAMRCYRGLDLPGIDILCDRMEYNTAKQAVSVARQNGSKGCMSEICGVTNWTFDFEGHKGSGDWQAALGITFRVPHLTWSSMAGEAKRDYPASIGYQSPWYREYKHIEDYFARLNTVLTRGKSVTKVAVIHPIESYWLCSGPVRENCDEQDDRERKFADLTNWLLHGLVDFDFISESLLPSQYGGSRMATDVRRGSRPKFPSDIRRTVLVVGHCEYEAVLVPNLRTIRSSTLRILTEFQEKGGKVIIVGDWPILVDALASKSIETIPRGWARVPFSEKDVLHAVEDQRDISIIGIDGKRIRRFLYQLRDDGTHRYLFVCNTERKTGRFTARATEISILGRWKLTLLDPFTGNARDVCCRVSRCGRRTVLDHHFSGGESILPQLSLGEPDPAAYVAPVLSDTYRVRHPVDLLDTTLSEDNVLLLDYAQYKLGDSGEWSDKEEEVLRIDNIIRTQLGFPLKLEAYRQPWSIPAEKRRPVTTVALRFTFESGIDVDTPVLLALEDAACVSISLNDVPITAECNGWWVDEAIQTVPLPPGSIRQGTNVMVIEHQFGLLTNLERIYILGRFGVSVAGSRVEICSSPPQLQFGNLTERQMPFYAGNITYNCQFTVDGPASEPLAINVPRFSCPVVAVTLDGDRRGLVYAEPYILELGEVQPGTHSLAVTAFGNRFNAFGHVHLPPGKSKWCGPLLWRTDDDWWSKEYCLHPFGILQAPCIMGKGRPKVAFWKEGPEY